MAKQTNEVRIGQLRSHGGHTYRIDGVIATDPPTVLIQIDGGPPPTWPVQTGTWVSVAELDDEWKD